MITFLDEILAATLLSMRQPVEAFVQLETADDNVTLVATDGSLISFVKLFGSRQIIGDTEYQWIVEQATLKLGARFDRPGYAMQFYFMRDPSTVGNDLERVMRGNRAAARAMELDLDDLLNERKRHLARYMAHEDIFLVLWTRPSVLTKSELQSSIKQRGEKKWVKAANAQYPMQALEALRTRHKSYVSSVVAALEEISMKAELIDTHAALASVRTSLYPHIGSEEWHANLPGDPLMPRLPQQGAKDASDLLWPPLRQQICTGDSAVLTPSIARIGNLLWGGVDITLAPAEPAPFPQLLARLIDNDIPFRLSFLIESAGAQSVGFRAFAAAVLAFSNQVNRQIIALRRDILQIDRSNTGGTNIKARD